MTGESVTAADPPPRLWHDTDCSLAVNIECCVCTIQAKRLRTLLECSHGKLPHDHEPEVTVRISLQVHRLDWGHSVRLMVN